MGVPCSAWATAADVCAPCNAYDFDQVVLDQALQVASEVLFEFSGRQFPGECSDIVRPCSRPIHNTVPWWAQQWGGWAGWSEGWSFWQASWGWCSCHSGRQCGCDRLSEITLGGSPITAITQVKVDGVVLDPSLYRVDDDRWLVRLPDPDGTNPGWPCFPAGTLVLTSTGQKPIEEIAEGEFVLTHRNRWRRVLRSGQTGISEVVEIRGRGGTIRSTPDHQFWSAEIAEPDPHRSGTWNRANRKLGAPEWTEAASLVGRAWAMPEHVEPLPVRFPSGWEMTQSFWRMAGRWVGDGWLQRYTGRRSGGYSVYICSGHHEADVVAEELGPRWHRTRERTTARFRLADASLHQWLGSEFGTGARNKRLPAWLIGAQEEVRRAFLSGLMAADGWRNDKRDQWSFRTVSHRLAVDVKLLAASLGFAPTMYDAEQTTDEIEGRRVNGAHTYRVDWGEARRKLQHWNDDYHVWGRVKSTELVEGAVPVFDLEVEDDNSFIAEGFVVHNCCQRMDLADTEPETFSVTFNYGEPLPAGAVAAAASLGCQLALACAGDATCQLPKRVTSVTRQGVSMVLLDPFMFFKERRTGLYDVDMWLSAVNPAGLQRRASVISPDIGWPVRRTT